MKPRPEQSVRRRWSVFEVRDRQAQDHRYAPSSERGRQLLDQAELQLEQFEAMPPKKRLPLRSMPTTRAAWSGASSVASRCGSSTGKFAARACRASWPNRMPLLWQGAVQMGETITESLADPACHLSLASLSSQTVNRLQRECRMPVSPIRRCYSASAPDRGYPPPDRRRRRR